MASVALGTHGYTKHIFRQNTHTHKINIINFLKIYLFYVYEYTVAVQMVLSHHVVVGFELRAFERAVSALNR